MPVMLLPSYSNQRSPRRPDRSENVVDILIRTAWSVPCYQLLARSHSRRLWQLHGQQVNTFARQRLGVDDSTGRTSAAAARKQSRRL